MSSGALLLCSPAWRAAPVAVACVVLGGVHLRAADLTRATAGPCAQRLSSRAEEGVGRSPRSFKELARDFESPVPQKRRTAVARLALLDMRPAWDLVLQGLQDKEPEVADAAQMALGAVRDPKLIRDLCGREGLGSNDAWVRLRVAEAFGRMAGPIDGSALLRAMSASQAELSRTLLWSVERLALSKHLSGDREDCIEALAKLCGSSSAPSLRAASLVALAALDRFAADPWVKRAAVDRESELRCAALRVARGSTEQECMTISVPLLDDPEVAVRTLAVENMERLASRVSIRALIERLDVEPRPRLRWRILGYLRAASGLDHGFESQSWKAWAETVTGRVATGERVSGTPVRLGDARVSFAGMTLLSDRVCFLVDFSGSLWKKNESGTTRKEIVDEKIESALEALPAGTLFNVIPYTGEPIPWEKALVPSTASNVKRALDFFRRCHASGRGNFYDAVQRALQDERVDTIMVLTDGLPTGGRRWNLELMVELLVEQNRYRNVAFDSILVDAPERLQKHWVELAERTGGRATAIELEGSP